MHILGVSSAPSLLHGHPSSRIALLISWTLKDRHHILFTSPGPPFLRLDRAVAGNHRQDIHPHGVHHVHSCHRLDAYHQPRALHHASELRSLFVHGFGHYSIMLNILLMMRKQFIIIRLNRNTNGNRMDRSISRRSHVCVCYKIICDIAHMMIIKYILLASDKNAARSLGNSRLGAFRSDLRGPTIPIWMRCESSISLYMSRHILNSLRETWRMKGWEMHAER